MEEPVLHGPWSHSRANSCSLALYKEKVLKAPIEPRPERLIAIDRRDLGRAMHEGMDTQLGAVVRGRDWADPKTLARDLIGEYPHLAPEVDEVERRLALFRERFRMSRDMDWQDRDSVIRNHMLGNEMRLAIDGQGNPCSFDDCPPDGWRGIVDYAEDDGEGTLLIIDGKNRPAIHTRSEVEGHEQLSKYLVLVAQRYPGRFTKFVAGIYYFEFGHTQLVPMDWDRVQDNWRRLQARAAHKESLDEDKIEPEPGWGKCQYCDYLESCPAGRQAIEPSLMVPTDAKSAEAAAKWLMVTDEKVKAVRTALRAYTQEHGPVMLDDATGVGYSVKETVEYDKNLSLRILKTLIADGKVDGKLSDFTSLNKRAVTKVAKKKEVAEALEPAVERGTKTDFDIFRSRKRVGVKVSKKNASSRRKVTKKSSQTQKPQRKVSGRVKSGARSKP